MFWGLVVQPNKKYSKTVSTPFHVSQAVLDVTNTPGDSDVQLILKSDKVDYILCVLNKSGTVQVPLNLIFSEGDEISFRSVGGTVHLTGYLVDDQNYPELEEGDSTDAEDEIPTRPGQKSKAAAAQDSDSENSDSEGEEASDDDGSEGEEELDDDSDNEGMQDSDEEDDEESGPPPAKVQKTNGMPNGVSKKEDKKKDNKHKKQQQQTAGDDEARPAVKKIQGGVTIEDIREGKGGPVKAGKKVQVYYEGRLKSNNKVFDKTNSGKGFEFVLGRGSVIKAWDLGVAGMKVGGKRRIICPPAMAYGAKGAPPAIPPNATLVFDVELRGVS